MPMAATSASANFDNFTIKGLVASDGRPKAAMYECKHVFQPASCELIDAEKATIKITNQYYVNNLDAYDAWLQIREDGIIISKKMLPRIHLAPGCDTVISLKKYLPEMKFGNEYLADIHFTLSQAEAWAGKGFEVAHDQFALNRQPLSFGAMDHMSRDESYYSKQSETDSTYVITRADYQIIFSKQNGALASYLYHGVEQIFTPFLPHFSRPVTDNDHRGWKADKKLAQWYHPDLKLQSMTAEGQTITSTYSLIHDSAKVIVVYYCTNKGAISMNYTLIANPALPNLPKVGFQGGIRRSFDNITWYGRGPMENYIDRNTGFDVGIYTQPITRFMEPYVVPQENGNRTDVRWMFLGNEKRTEGLLISGVNSLLSMSAWPYTEANIVAAKHTNKLRDAGYITLNIDLAQMGVGGNDSWTEQAAPLPQYQLPAKEYHYNFCIRPAHGDNQELTNDAMHNR